MSNPAQQPASVPPPQSGGPPDLAAIKQVQQAIWASGDFAVIGVTLQIVGETLAEAADIRAGRRLFNMRYASAAHWLQVFRDFYGPTQKAFMKLDSQGQAVLERDIIALLERFNTAGKSSLVVPAEYLEAVITKRSL